MRKSEAYQKNTKEQYETLGRFVEAFEMMVDEVRTCCMMLMGPNPFDDRLPLIAFHHGAMTAKPLFDIMRAMIAQLAKRDDTIDDDERPIFKGVLAQKQVTQARTVHFDLTYAVVTDDIAASHIGGLCGYASPSMPDLGHKPGDHVIDLAPSNSRLMRNTVGQHDQDIVVGRQQIPGGNIAVRDEYPILRQNKVHQPTPIEGVVSLSGMRQI